MTASLQITEDKTDDARSPEDGTAEHGTADEAAAETELSQDTGRAANDAVPPADLDGAVGALFDLEPEEREDEAEFAADPRTAQRRREKPRGGFVEALTPIAIWTSLLLMVGALVYAAWLGTVDLLVASVFGGGILVFGTMMLVATLSRAYSPLLLAGLFLRRREESPQRPAVLAGGDILSALGLAEGILSADPEARLVTTKEGVVVYANEAYMRIAESAGVIGATGLPPRIDRLFGQAGRESTKMFRLARAARSSADGDEVITQAMGAAPAPGEDTPRRRFEVSVRPMRTAGGRDYAAWRLREVPIENARDDLRAAFANYPRAVMAVERSGAIAWLNRAGETAIGVRTGASVALQDFVLGETSDLVAALWDGDGEEVEARMRDLGGPSRHKGVILTSFARGGVGEGFVCVEMVPKEGLAREAGAQELSSDVTDAPFGVAVLEGDPGSDAKVIFANRLIAEILPAEVGASIGSVLPSGAMRELAAALRSRPPSQPLTRGFDVTLGAGPQARIVRLSARPIRRRRGAYGPRQTVLYAVDITRQRRMEEDHTQDQKLKQIGQLAGAVAHDFNNLLLVVMGSTELLMRRHAAGDPSYPDLVLIKENAQRARNLTQNLLAFSRKQTLQQEVLSLTDVLSDFTPFLARYVTERVKLDVCHGRGLPQVRADKGQLELALMNLAVNARDAMPGGGQLSLTTKHVPADEIAAYGYAVLPDTDHVLIEIADTGKGVPEGIADKIFDPFFTTKGEGKGTGLGLSTVHGIVGQMGGRIFLFNRPGEGATFRIFLPALTEEEARAASHEKVHQPNENADLTGKGRILIVEDEDGVRNIITRALGMCGYEIVEAEDGEEALEIIEDEAQPFDLVLTDIMMPEMDGPTLITQAGDKLRGAKVIFMSGYAEAAMRDKLAEIDGAGYLQKPFTLKKVAAVVKETLGAG